MQGTWKVVGSEQDGERVPADEIKDLFLIFKADSIHIREGGKTEEKFAFTLDPQVRNYDVFDVSDRLRQHGWLVPAYTFPENRQDLSALRIVVRAGMNHEMAYTLLDHLEEETKFLQSLDAPLPGVKREAFRH